MATTGHEEKVEIILAVIGTVLLFGPLLAYYRILTDSYKNAQLSTLASQINASRTALFLPTYAVIMFLSLVILVRILMILMILVGSFSEFGDSGPEFYDFDDSGQDCFWVW